MMCEFANVRMCELNGQFAHPHIRKFAHYFMITSLMTVSPKASLTRLMMFSF
jgi:hypothetical protein